MMLPGSLIDRARDFGSLGCRFDSCPGIGSLGRVV